MSAYKQSIKHEIAMEKSKIKELYLMLRTADGKEKIQEIYSEIASRQQSIIAKKQRLSNVGKSFIQPNNYVIFNNK